MGDAEEILAEPDELGFFQSSLESIFKVTGLLASNGWYIVGLGAIAYYVYKNYLTPSGPASDKKGHVVQSSEELASKQAKDEARRLAMEKLQAKYQKESDERAVKLKELEDKKRLERIAELERLEALRNGGLGHALGSGGGNSKKAFRPEYNPLMGDTSSSSRACFRPSGGRQGG